MSTSMDHGAGQEDFERSRRIVESVLRDLGLDPDASRLATTDGATAWTLQRGSAEVLVFLNPARAKSPSFVRFVSPIWRLPTENQPAIFRKLLEMNALDLFGAAFGLMGEDAVLVSERATRDMDRSEVEELLENIGAAADYFDDWLVTHFGGQRLADLRGA